MLVRVIVKFELENLKCCEGKQRIAMFLAKSVLSVFSEKEFYGFIKLVNISNYFKFKVMRVFTC